MFGLGRNTENSLFCSPLVTILNNQQYSIMQVKNQSKTPHDPSIQNWKQNRTCQAFKHWIIDINLIQTFCIDWGSRQRHLSVLWWVCTVSRRLRDVVRTWNIACSSHFRHSFRWARQGRFLPILRVRTLFLRWTEFCRASLRPQKLSFRWWTNPCLKNLEAYF